MPRDHVKELGFRAVVFQVTLLHFSGADIGKEIRLEAQHAYLPRGSEATDPNNTLTRHSQTGEPV